MRLTKIPKRNGTFRTVAVPTKLEQKKLDEQLPVVTQLMKRICSKDVHGFFPLRSPVTNARAHIGRRYSLCFDIKDFFDNVTFDKLSTIDDADLRAFLLSPNSKVCFLDGVAKQGLSTSPALANIAGSIFDASIKAALKVLEIVCVYTRYADDITISFDTLSDKSSIESVVGNCLNRAGYAIAEQKTKFYRGDGGGLRKITGVCVGSTAVHASRESRRNLRAAMHQENTSSAEGLREWRKLRTNVPEHSLFYDLCQARYGKKLRPRQVEWAVDTPRLGESRLVITNDPAAVLGAGTFFARGKRRLHINKSGNQLYNLALAENIYVAYLSYGSTKMWRGFTVPVMYAAVLLVKIADAFYEYAWIHDGGRGNRSFFRSVLAPIALSRLPMDASFSIRRYEKRHLATPYTTVTRDGKYDRHSSPAAVSLPDHLMSAVSPDHIMIVSSGLNTITINTAVAMGATEAF